MCGYKNSRFLKEIRENITGTKVFQNISYLNYIYTAICMPLTRLPDIPGHILIQSTFLFSKFVRKLCKICS